MTKLTNEQKAIESLGGRKEIDKRKKEWVDKIVDKFKQVKKQS